ncbi:hydroxyisourate hydrolase [Serratia ficaria]|uniref:5-hydroxyisourate hydrolase n=1 Tax=Serratia ficaria TaxID=61651 RepID=A0A240B4L7_SERFI|nr:MULTISPECIES: hydroxyisourate hydrolase [Serratia]MEE4483237.1 hydroxyisourate hydrolase [Serratia ficaria]REF46211.1 5-hydroxyisourate hydrolase [Serratia ficaria]CAI0874902.1 5-hydroxyisourate hydrolase precursor [Serratia ficaria]CAI0951562.1 5-hydroxyisourate hydrolase precursor [Serratia ficaria]CAI0994087.1 5-hydroxyisourate hydrolase precursor [Serratia ficaria]
MSNISTHILDTSVGKPAANVRVWLERECDGQWLKQAESRTDADGRVRDLTPEGAGAGHYRLHADLGAYFAADGRETLYRTAIIEVAIRDAAQHYHLPLLIGPYSYSTYRGS